MLDITFCTKQTPNLHDYIFDAKEFCRKLAWCAFYEDKKKKTNTQDDSEVSELFSSDEETEDSLSSADPDTKVTGWTMSSKLKIKSRKSPEFKDTLLSSITEKIKSGVELRAELGIKFSL